MFDVNATDGSARKRKYESPIPESQDGSPAKMPSHKLDSREMVEQHGRMLDHYVREMDRQHDNRLEMAEEEDFYDNIQWQDDDAQEVRDRGQVPLVYNVVSASVDWVLGTEKRSRTDYKVLPRRKEQGKPAERKTQLLKYLSDVNRTPFHTSRAFEDAIKAGIGWIEDGLTDDGDGEPIYDRYESWRNILFDSAATDMDLQDGRYMFRVKWIDEDIACAMFPERDALVRRSTRDSDDFMNLSLYGDDAMDAPEEGVATSNSTTTANDRVYGYYRRRVRVIEGWIRIPVKTERLRGGDFDREIYDKFSPGHRESVESGEAEVVSKVQMRMHVAIFTSAGMLYFGVSPYRHNRFPFTPVWGNRRGRDGLPYGMIRRLKDIQRDINKRASKALYILSSNKVVMDEGAVDDLDEFREEVGRPDAILIKKKGYELTLNADRQLADAHMEMMSRSISLVQSAGGVTDENLGRRTNAVSGKAIVARQEQGSLATAKYFDNLLFARQVRGEKRLSLVEQFMSEKKAFRITNMRGQPEYIEINDGLPENDIVRSKADFIIDEEDFRASVRQAAVDQLLEVISKFPAEVSIALLDLVVEDMDLKNREEIVRRIRQISGQRDPDQEEPTPEEQAQMQDAAAAKEFQMELMRAQLRKLLAEAAKNEESAKQIARKMVGDDVDAQLKALQAGREALAMPASTHVADHILAESGFVAQSDMPMPALPATAPPGQAPGIMAPPATQAPPPPQMGVGLTAQAA